MKLNNKKGISLIVLVITIIVMIILAAAIIVSLSSNGIIGKANKAQTDTNNSQLTEAASLHLAEYDLLSKTGDTSVAGKDAQTYVREKLVANGFTEEEAGKVSVVDGEVVVAGNTQKSLAERIEELNVPVGATVSGYTLSQKSYTTSGNENNGVAQTLATVTNLVWRYAGMDSNGDVIIVADIPSQLPSGIELTVSNVNGAINGPTEMNNACEELYSISDKGIGRAMSKEDVLTIGEGNSMLDANYTYSEPGNNVDRGPLESKWYYLSSYTTEDISPGEVLYNIDFCGGSLGTYSLGSLFNGAEENEGVTIWAPFRPVVELDESVEVSYENGVLVLK